MAFNPQKAADAAARRFARGVRIDARIKWYGDKIVSGVEQTFTARLKVVGTLLRDRIIAHISIPIGFSIGPRGVIRVTERSKPGERPRTQAPLPTGGMLVRSIFFEMVTPDWLRVGTTLDYGLMLELGTSRMAPRPYFLRTFYEQLPQLRRIFGAPITVLPGVPFAPPNP